MFSIMLMKPFVKLCSLKIFLNLQKTTYTYFQSKVASSAASFRKGNLCSNGITTKGLHLLSNEKKMFIALTQRFYSRGVTSYLRINQFTTMTLKCKG